MIIQRLLHYNLKYQTIIEKKDKKEGKRLTCSFILSFSHGRNDWMQQFVIKGR